MTRVILSALALIGLEGQTTAFNAAELSHRSKLVCVTLDAEDIGQLPLTFTVGTTNVKFTGWKTRAMTSPRTESIGFSIEASGPLTWAADEGAERGFTGTATDFIDELALVKPNAPTLTRLVLCEARSVP
jgi:hypothetical protein